MTKKYQGNKPLKTILTACKKNHWPVSTQKYDEDGSDFIMFGFIYKADKFEVLYNTCSGRFMVRQGKKIITEESTDMDDVPWYAALLDFIYTPLKSNKKSAA